MAEIGEPVRKEEYWPVENPVPVKTTRKEPILIPEVSPEPQRSPEREREPIPA
ncbi:MAG: hypothetical protein WAP23_02190 [Candidatus Spechtbacterales bacterium]